MAIVYVLNNNGIPLMQTTRCGHVRYLLNHNKAKVVTVNPFAIQLLYETPNAVQPLILGIDPGRTNIGVAVVAEKNEKVECIFHANVLTRNKDIPRLMKKRKAFRMKHRQNKRRKKRQRRAKYNHTVKAESFTRRLPKCEKDITCHYIKNKEARFCNRKRPEGWLTPTANQLLQTHLNLIAKISKFLPVSDVVIESNKFAFMRMEDKTIHGLQFCNGALKGFQCVEDAVYATQDGHCLFCDAPIEHYHHVVARHKNGSETLKNRCGLCAKHHTLVHTTDEWNKKLNKLIDGMKKQYDALGVLNQILPQLIANIEIIYPNHTFVTTGYQTSLTRKSMSISKDHCLDAFCIAYSYFLNQNQSKVFDLPTNKPYLIKQFRRHDRQCCHKENLDRKYLKDGKVVATNRHRAFEQKAISLEEYVNNGGSTYGLTAKEHKPIYKRKDRYMPGSLFNVNGEIKVLTASTGFHNGKPDYYIFDDNAKINPKKCSCIKRNGGLTFVK